ncbi:MAG: hypothetical protein PHX68_01820 [Alphaproteobacteria bacterium]|nr:hypothetical protein [Alphaproteobacteria bacterium]
MISKKWIALVLLCIALFFSAAAGAQDAKFQETLNDYFGATDGSSICWFCPVFQAILLSVNSLTKYTVTGLSGPLLVLLSVGLLFFLVFKIGKFLVSFQAVDIGALIPELTGPLGRGIIASILLFEGGKYMIVVFASLLNPILDIGMDLSTRILQSTMDSTTMQIIQAGQDPQAIANAAAAGAAAPGSGSSKAASGLDPDSCPFRMQNADYAQLDKSALTGREINSILCWMGTVSSSLGVGMATGATLMKASLTAGSWGIPNFSMLLIGLAVWFSFFALFLSFPFKLFDAIIGLGFVLALMPFWIVLWVFPQTSGYTKKAWDKFIGSIILFLCLSVVISFVIVAMNSAIPNREQLFQLLLEGRSGPAADLIGFSGKSLFITMAMGWLSFSMLGSAQSLAQSFGGGGMELGMNKTAVSGAVNATQRIVKPAAKVAAKGVKKLDEKYTHIGEHAKHAAQVTRSAAKNTFGVKATAARVARAAGFQGGDTGRNQAFAAARKTAHDGKFAAIDPRDKIEKKFQTTDTGMTATYDAENAAGVKQEITETYDAKTGLMQKEFRSYVPGTNTLGNMSEIKDAHGNVIGTRTYNPRGYTQNNTNGTTETKLGNKIERRDTASGRLIYHQDINATGQRVTENFHADGITIASRAVATGSINAATNKWQSTREQTDTFDSTGTATGTTTATFAYDAQRNLNQVVTTNADNSKLVRNFNNEGISDIRFNAKGQRMMSKDDDTRDHFGNNRMDTMGEMLERAGSGGLPKKGP